MWISKEKYEDIERRVKELNEELQRLYNMAYLVDIKRDGMKNRLRKSGIPSGTCSAHGVEKTTSRRYPLVLPSGP